MNTNNYKQEVKVLSGLAAPVIVGQIAQVATGFTDTVMAGRLGALDLGAIAVGVNLWILPFLFVLGLLMALSSMTAHYYGARHYGAIRDLLFQALVLGAVLAVFSWLSTRGLADGLYLLELDADITQVAAAYVKAVSWGLPATVGYLGLRFLSEGIGYTKPMMVIQLFGLALNALLNYVLMFGKFGAPAMGAEGAGWATAIVMWVNLFLLLGYVLTHKRYVAIWQAESAARDWTRLREMLHVGAPIAITLLAEVGMFVAVALLMGKIGVVEVAAHQVALNFAAMAFMIPLGISTAITIRVGHALGEGRASLVRFRGVVGMSFAGVCMLFTAGIMLIFPELIAAIYTEDTQVRELAVGLLFMAAMFQLSDGVQISANGALRGMKDTMYPMLVTLVVYWLFGMPLSYYLGFTRAFGPQGLWMGLVVSLTVAAIWLVWRFFRLSGKGLVDVVR